ncbi:MAG: peptidase T [Atopobiaceae bacterium]|nr:peptidase T [Atopobiaceae bacterium]
MDALQRLLRYLVVRTPSDENNDTACPSSPDEFELARLLEQELRDLGIEDVRLSDDCFVYAKVPATPGFEDAIKLGLIAHMDTVSQFCDHEIRPQLHENYDGGDLPLGDSGRTLTVRDFPHLPSLAGRTLLTSDGTTILGVDDKAGITEIMAALEQVLASDAPHGPLRIAFTPDEEIGTGVSHFDVAGFDADVAYTMDGDTEGGIQYQNFNACEATFKIRGVSVHPGEAKDIMVNAALVACEVNAMLPGCEIPRCTEVYEGFYHLLGINGDETQTEMSYIVRDFDAASFEARKATLRHIEKTLNERWGAGTVELAIEDEYQNMENVIGGCPFTIDLAKQACERAGIAWDIQPIRGGTDGAQLSFRGLPCPNRGTGGHAFHGPFEHATVEGIDAATRMLVELVGVYAEHRN